MKKHINIKNLSGLLVFFFLLQTVTFFSSCKPEVIDYSSIPVQVTSVHLSAVKYPDRLITYTRLGNLIRVEGSGFLGLTKVYINGVSVYINPTLMSDNSLIIRVPSDAPTTEADSVVRNKIRFVKGNVDMLVYPFEIRAAAPTITNISHTLAQAGEEITITGTNLYEVSKVTFPGAVAVTSGIVSDADGKFCTLIVPTGITASGSLLVEGSSGAAYSPPYFNYKKGILNNFDDVNTYSWGGGFISGDLTTIIPTVANVPKSQGKYRSLNGTGSTFVAATPKQSYGWCKSNYFVNYVDSFPLTTSTSNMAFQFDIYVAGDWNSGSVHVVILDEFPTGQLYEYDYAPWIDKTSGKAVRSTFKNDGWFTVTVPLSSFGALTGDKTFKALIDKEATTQYHQYGLFFNNTDLEGIPSIATNIVIYFDNFRFVSLETPTYNEYGN